MQFDAFAVYSAAMGVAAEVIPEAQSSDYESGIVQIDADAWHIRTARNTPTKSGAFVAFWRRDAKGKIIPFGDLDPAAGLFVFVAQNDRRGMFRSTAAHLVELGVTSGKGPGKRGFRVYPSWCVALNAQAVSTQRIRARAFQEF
ncbi:MepB family protein [Microbacterium trichothecenolyticum]|uniref:Metallopeptidase n=1 Tax=Microbacterium trichothecenolyticum TaxID=69370 RepID=A0ABU0TRD1_MICTR|nr:MepB family protein [Microbacterium trichothecenolyticum]MDQ1122227.1 hypothetical protein [Microbacterium trichothecenolyticum]